VEPDRPQQDRHAACFIALQYSSTTFASSRFHRQRKVWRAFKKYYCFVFCFLKIA
jgi:hypothetical protein